MNRYGLQIAVSVLTVLVAVAVSVRSFLLKNRFDRTVSEALKTSEGYDQKLIDMVNRLEYELALRAGFGYTGQKDPMTGKERIVVRTQNQIRRPAAVKAVTTAPAVSEQSIDSVKLTAIIYDDEKKTYTAIVMVGERSFAVEVGDYVVGRRIVSINSERVIMEDDVSIYTYDIAGNKGKREKPSAVMPETYYAPRPLFP